MQRHNSHLKASNEKKNANEFATQPNAWGLKLKVLWFRRAMGIHYGGRFGWRSGLSGTALTFPPCLYDMVLKPPSCEG